MDAEVIRRELESMREELATKGFTVVSNALGEPERACLLKLTAAESVANPVQHRSGVAFAARALLGKVPGLRSALQTCGIDNLASQILDEPAFPIDAIYFDKQASANWAVPGHQDRVMPVENEPAGSHRVRDGIAYAEPDPETLSQLVSLRIHFDSTDARTGALSFVPGSHRHGILPGAQIQEIPPDRYVPCEAAAGDVIMMRPLVLHRSSPLEGDGHRRVLHVVYATKPPNCGLAWRR